MNLFVYTGASNLAQAVVTSASDLTPVSPNPGLVFGDTEPLTLKFLSASGVYESWTLAGGYSVVVSLGEPNTDGSGAYVQTSNFADVTNGFSGALQLTTQSLAGALNNKRGSSPTASFTLHVRVTSPDGITQTYARQLVTLAASVSVALTPDSTPVNFATFAEVQAAKTAAAASASAANVSAGNSATSATNAAASAVNASASAGAAYQDRLIAGNSATTAASHAASAQTSAANAAGSALAATSGAGTATASAASATLSESNAATSAASAAASQTSATTSATTAADAATNAQIFATNANNSAIAAAASAATASTVSGSGNGTFANANLTGVTSVTAGAAVNLSLNGGSSGAAITLGQGANGSITLTPKGSGTVSIGASASLNGAGNPIKGTTTNDNAAVGYVGEFLNATVGSGGAMSLTTGALLSVTSLSLTPGDWDVYASAVFTQASGTTATDFIVGVSNSTGGWDGGETSYARTGFLTSNVTTLTATLPAVKRRISVAVTTSIYLLVRGTFSGGTLTVFGNINARRVR